MTEEIKASNVYRQRFLLAEIIEYTASGIAMACDYNSAVMENDEYIQLQAQLRPAIAVKAGIYFLDPGHGITAWNIRAFREEG